MADHTQESLGVVRAFAQLSPPEQQEVARSLNLETYPKGDKYKAQIWLLLLGGLFFIALAAIVAAVILDVKDKDGTAVVAIASAVVAGVLGLFASPPTGKSG